MLWTNKNLRKSKLKLVKLTLPILKLEKMLLMTMLFSSLLCLTTKLLFWIKFKKLKTLLLKKLVNLLILTTQKETLWLKSLIQSKTSMMETGNLEHKKYSQHLRISVIMFLPQLEELLELFLIQFLVYLVISLVKLLVESLLVLLMVN